MGVVECVVLCVCWPFSLCGVKSSHSQNFLLVLILANMHPMLVLRLDQCVTAIAAAVTAIVTAVAVDAIAVAEAGAMVEDGSLP